MQVMGKDVVSVGQLSPEVEQAAYHVHVDGSAPADYGVIVHMDHGGHKIIKCDTADYRDNTLVPFFAHYDAVVRIETFGPAES